MNIIKIVKINFFLHSKKIENLNNKNFKKRTNIFASNNSIETIVYIMIRNKKI